MNRCGKITACLACALALNTALHAQDVALPGNPYAMIVARNIFGLNPPPPPVDPNAAPAEPAIKITPNGIMSIFGQLQVLFKTSGSGKPTGAADPSYILSEGQRQDGIEEVKIDDKAGIVTFNNHGVEEKLPLANASSTAAAGAPTTAFNFAAGPGGKPGGAGNNGANGANPFGISGVNNGGGNPGAQNGAANNSNLQAIPTRSGGVYGQQEQIKPDVQTVMMEVYREMHKDDPSYPTLPPTPLTPPDATNPDGTPVVKPDLDQ